MYEAANASAMFLYSRPTTMPSPYSPNGMIWRITDRGRINTVLVKPAPWTPICRVRGGGMNKKEKEVQIKSPEFETLPKRRDSD